MFQWRQDFYLPIRRREVSEDGLPDDFSGFVHGEQVGVEDQVIGEGIGDIGIEVGLHVPGASRVFVQNEFAGCLGIEGFVGLNALGAFIKGTDHADVEGGGGFLEDDVGGAADDDAVPDLGEAEDGFGDFQGHFLGGGVQAEKFLHGCLNVGGSVLRHELGEFGREIVFGEDAFHQGAMEDGPGRGRGGAMFLEVSGEVFGDGDAS